MRHWMSHQFQVLLLVRLQAASHHRPGRRLESHLFGLGAGLALPLQTDSDPHLQESHPHHPAGGYMTGSG